MQGGGGSAEQAQALEEKRAAKDVLSDLEFIGSCAGPSSPEPASRSLRRALLTPQLCPGSLSIAAVRAT